jgi:hypothetical protein
VWVEFKKEHTLGRSERRHQAEAVSPGDKRDLPAWQATELADRGIAKLLEKDPKQHKPHTEEFVRERLGTMDKAKVLGKLESRKVKVPKGADKAALIDLYVEKVDPGKKGKKGGSQ